MNYLKLSIPLGSQSAGYLDTPLWYPQQPPGFTHPTIQFMLFRFRWKHCLCAFSFKYFQPSPMSLGPKIIPLHSMQPQASQKVGYLWFKEPRRLFNSYISVSGCWTSQRSPSFQTGYLRCTVLGFLSSEHLWSSSSEVDNWIMDKPTISSRIVSLTSLTTLLFRLFEHFFQFKDWAEQVNSIKPFFLQAQHSHGWPQALCSSGSRKQQNHILQCHRSEGGDSEGRFFLLPCWAHKPCTVVCPQLVLCPFSPWGQNGTSSRCCITLRQSKWKIKRTRNIGEAILQTKSY